MIVRDLDLVGISTLPAKAHSIPLVDADAMLRAPIAFQSFKAVTGRDRQIPQITRAIDLIELSS